MNQTLLKLVITFTNYGFVKKNLLMIKCFGLSQVALLRAEVDALVQPRQQHMQQPDYSLDAFITQKTKCRHAPSEFRKLKLMYLTTHISNGVIQTERIMHYVRAR